MIRTLLNCFVAHAGRESCLRTYRLISAWAAVLAVSGAAQGVIVHPDTSASASDPALVAAYSTFPYWNYIGIVNGGTGVYLDNGWVLTANHVGAGNITLNGQLHYYDASVPTVRLRDPAQPQNYTDLLLFKLTQQLPLTPVQISQDEPTVSQSVLMTGGGYERAASSTTWDVDMSTNPWTWTTPATKPQLPNITGYLTQSPRAVRWGSNRLSDGTAYVNIGGVQVYVFGTQFNSSGTTYEAQAVNGDSGGGVWWLHDGQWELTGTILSVSVLSGQPSGIGSGMLDYSKTYAADLSYYRAQIMEVIFEAAILGDLNDDKRVNGLDMSPFITALTEPAVYRQQYPQVDFLGTADINGDGLVNGLDISPFISLLVGGGGQGGPGLSVPEPASGLATLGGLWLILWGGGKGRRGEGPTP